MEQLLCRIEELRYQLYNLAKGKYLADPEVVYVSQELDQLLNEYHQENFAKGLLKVG